MQIVVVANSYPAERRPASEPSYTAIAQELARRGHGVTAVTCAEPGRAGREEISGVRVVRTLVRVDAAETSAATIARACRALRQEIRGRERVVVLFADAGDLPAALLSVPSRGALWVDLGYDWPLTGFAVSHPWWTNALALRGMARLTAKALGAAIDPPDVQEAAFVVWNEARWKELLVRGLPVQSAHVLRPGVDTRLFAYRPPETGDGEIRLQYQGPLRRDGGLNAVFLGLQRLPARVRLRIVAESTEASYLAELGELGRAADVMDRVDVMPAVAEAQRLALLREAHVFVHSRETAEEFPRHALEAAAAGVPVVAARVHGEDRAAWIWGSGAVSDFPAGDPRLLAARVEEILSQPDAAAERTRAARRIVESRFGVSYAADQLEPLLGGA